MGSTIVIGDFFANEDHSNRCFSEHDEFEDQEPIKPEELTCFKCQLRNDCEYVDDLYNTDGDCLALK